jgi:hypothetical protein
MADGGGLYEQVRSSPVVEVVDLVVEQLLRVGPLYRQINAAHARDPFLRAMEATIAPPPWSWVSTWAISIACLRLMPRTWCVPSCSAWAASAAETGRPPTPLSSPEIWGDAKLWRDFAESLPNDRLSKFQDLMPDWVEQEVVAGYLLSSKNAMNWCNLPPDRHS